MAETRVAEGRSMYLVGGGIASLAAAAFLIRDGDVPGSRITILEESGVLGGSLDASGDPEHGYVMRGGRMIESKYVCTYDLFSSIPTLDGEKTVTEEIFEWNEVLKTSSKSRLFRAGHRVDAPSFGLSEKDILAMERLMVEPEGMLGRRAISDNFQASFFKTNFWLMWCTTFAFQPWHSLVEFKRYLMRFSHMVAGFNRLEGIMRTVYNQYDSMVRPLEKWLAERDVKFELNTRVTDLSFCHDASGYTVDKIHYEREGTAGFLRVKPEDLVMVTLGSMTEGSSVGAMDVAPELKGKREGGAWRLWEQIARGAPQFGTPANFCDHIEESKWISFTVTLHDPMFFRLICDLTGNVAGEGGLITFPESSWLASIVLPKQPHFIGQPEDVNVFWGYGLAVDALGDWVRKPMSACSGREILREVMHHLGMEDGPQHVLDSCKCIPCMMPFITSQFLRRSKGDRPPVVPERSKNLAFMGQFCEMPDDVVFTVEYSVRSAQAAVYQMLQLERTVPPVYKGYRDPRVVAKVLMALHGKTPEAPATEIVVPVVTVPDQ